MGDSSGGDGTFTAAFFGDGVGGFFFLVGVSGRETKIVPFLLPLHVLLRFTADAGLVVTPFKEGM